MVRGLIHWSVHNPVIVLLLAAALLACGGYAFLNVNVEAYPDPAPAIIEVVAQFPGASAEEVERQVTIPLEVALAGMPGLEVTRSKSLFGLSHIRNQFDYSRDYEQAKQDVLNRLAMVNLPAGVQPQISPASPIGEILRYTLTNPNDASGKPVYALADLKAVQEYVLQRELLRVPRVAGVTGVGGAVKRYEVQPDPVQLRKYGVTLQQLQAALGACNANGSGDNLAQGQTSVVVRSLGLIGQGAAPHQAVLTMKSPAEAARYLRDEEARRCREIRQVVVASVNNVPVRVDHLVDGGPMLNSDGTQREGDSHESNLRLMRKGVVVSHLTRQGRVAISLPQGDSRWSDEDDVVQGVVLLRKGQESLPALKAVLARIDELNQSGNLPPGVQIRPFYNRSDLINKTTETVHENLVVGMALVVAVLLMFLGNVPAALIVAINVPLALLFAFGVLFARSKSANLLSIGAVDFGIIVDSSVIIVESIYRAVSQGKDADKPLAQRIEAAAGQVTNSLFFATLVMVCALLPLFTMKGPEGQIFGPMADTYAFALAGALLLAVTVSPVLCLIFFGDNPLTRGLAWLGAWMARLFGRSDSGPASPPAEQDNFLVRWLKWAFVTQLAWVLRLRWPALVLFLLATGYTGYVAANMGREFMPELEEGNMMVRGTFPVNIGLDEVARRSRQLRAILRNFDELGAIVTTIGRPDDGTDPTGYYNLETFIPLRPQADWPEVEGLGRKRTKAELVKALEEEVERQMPGVDLDVSQIIRDNVMEALSGVKGENSIKVFGPDLERLESLAEQIHQTIEKVPGVQNAGVFRVKGQSSLEFPVNKEKCAKWNVSAADVQAVIQTAVGGKAATQVQEGERVFDLTVRWPPKLRADEQSILAIPVPVSGNTVSGPPVGLSPSGTAVAPPSPTGSAASPAPLANPVPVRRLSELVTPLGPRGELYEGGSFLRQGASTVFREQGGRMIAIKFEVRGRDLANTVAEAKAKVAPLLEAPYRAEWSGEFRQMEEAEARMARMFAVSLLLIVVLLYLAFRSVLDAGVVLANVVVVGLGGVWALKLTGLNFNISAAVGFISILGVAVMNGLILISSFNSQRAHGVPLDEALREGVRQWVRPVIMTTLTAILGLLPAAIFQKMGSESQRPLAVVVVGGMIATILFFNLVPLLYSLYGGREPPEGSGDMVH